MHGVNGKLSNRLPPPPSHPPAGIPTNTLAAPEAGSVQLGCGSLEGRMVAIGTGENNRTAHAACASIKSLLSGLSNMLMAAMLSPVTLLKGVHSYVIRPCMDEFKSMWDDANSSGPPRPAYRPPANLSALDRSSQSLNDWINQKLGVDKDT